MKKITVQNVLDSIHCDRILIGSKDLLVSKALPIDSADDLSITFCNKKGDHGRMLIGGTNAKLIVASMEHEEFCRSLDDRTFVLVEEPRLAFSRVLDAYFSFDWPAGVHSSAVVSGSAILGGSVHIGPLCSVGNDVEIGEGSRLEGSVVVHDGVKIGRNVIIRAGVVIGTDGFGFSRNKEGVLEKFPQIGGVVIEDDVEIGANTCVARGALSDTRIGKGTKIDNLVQVAHNVQIGQHCIITSLVWLGGSVKIGDRCWIAPSTSILNGIKVGNDVTVAMGSVVIKDVNDGEFVAGNPARPTIRK